MLHVLDASIDIAHRVSRVSFRNADGNTDALFRPSNFALGKCNRLARRQTDHRRMSPCSAPKGAFV